MPVGLASDAVDLIVNTAYKAVFPDSEDCKSCISPVIDVIWEWFFFIGLSINVVVPVGTTSADKLPVAVVSNSSPA